MPKTAVGKPGYAMTPKMKAFARAYAERGFKDAGPAAVEAGYASQSAGFELRTHPAVKKEVERLRVEYEGKPQITPERVLEELELIARARPGDMVDVTADGEERIRWDSLTEAQRAAIASLEVKGDRVTVKFADKLGALKELAKIMGISKETLELTGTVTVTDIINDRVSKIIDVTPEEEQ